MSAAAQRASPSDARQQAAPLLEVRELRTHFTTDAGRGARGRRGELRSSRAGETLGIVGESGSGKSVTALSIMRLLEDGAAIAGGEIIFRGRNVLTMRGQELRQLRGGDVAMIFQDPMTSLNPVLRIARQLIEGLRRARPLHRADRARARGGPARPDGHHERPSARSTPIRTSSRAACASA